MPRLSGKRIGLALLVMALFAPVFLAVGSPAFRPDWLAVRVATVPLSVWWVGISFVVFVGLTWAFSGEVFTDDQAGAGDDQ